MLSRVIPIDNTFRSEKFANTTFPFLPCLACTVHFDVSLLPPLIVKTYSTALIGYAHVQSPYNTITLGPYSDLTFVCNKPRLGIQLPMVKCYRVITKITFLEYPQNIFDIQ